MYQNTRSCPQLLATFSSSKSVFLGVFYFGQFVVVPSSSSSSPLERLTFQRSAFQTAFRFMSAVLAHTHRPGLCRTRRRTVLPRCTVSFPAHCPVAAHGLASPASPPWPRQASGGASWVRTLPAPPATPVPGSCRTGLVTVLHGLCAVCPGSPFHGSCLFPGFRQEDSPLWREAEAPGLFHLPLHFLRLFSLISLVLCKPF